MIEENRVFKCPACGGKALLDLFHRIEESGPLGRPGHLPSLISPKAEHFAKSQSPHEAFRERLRHQELSHHLTKTSMKVIRGVSWHCRNLKCKTYTMNREDT